MEVLLSFNRSVARAIIVIVSVSCLLFLIPYFSSFYSSFESVYEFLLALPAPDFSGGDLFVDKKTVFLLCNGIILCVSGLLGSGSSLAQNLQDGEFTDLTPVVISGNLDEKVGKESSGSPLKIVPLDFEDDKEHENEEEEEEEEQGSLNVSEEETDERFESFIRKMRKQIGTVSFAHNINVRIASFCKL